MSPFWKVRATGYLLAEISVPVVPPLVELVSSAAPVTVNVPDVAIVNCAAVTMLSIELPLVSTEVHSGRVALL